MTFTLSLSVQYDIDEPSRMNVHSVSILNLASPLVKSFFHNISKLPRIDKSFDIFVKLLYNQGMKTPNTFENLMEHFVQIVNKYNELDGIAFDYGTGKLLHPSEIHALNAIQSADQPNITELSEKLGITKSAASQIVQRLSRKGLAEKFKASGNAKDVLIRLTNSGLQARNSFLKMRGDIFGELLHEFNSMEQSQIDFLDLLFRRIDTHFDRVIKERKN